MKGLKMTNLQTLLKVRDCLKQLLDLGYRKYDTMTELGYVNEEINQLVAERDDALEGRR